MKTDDKNISQEELMKKLKEVKDELLQLRQQNELSSTFFNQASLAVIKISTEGIIEYANNFACQFFGFTPDDFNKTNILSKVPEEQIKESLENIKNLTPEKPLYYNFIQHILPNKRIVYYAWCNIGVFDRNKELLYLISYCFPKDIQEGISRELRGQIASEINLNHTNHEIISSVLQMLMKQDILSCDDTLSLINEHYKAEASFIVKYSSKKDKFRIKDIILEKESRLNPLATELANNEFESDSVYFNSFRNGNLNIIYNGEWQPDNEITDLLHEYGIQYQSIICAPIFLHEELYGVLVIIREQYGQRWNESEITLIHLFSRLVSLNIERIRTHYKLEYEQRLTTLALKRSEVYSWEYNVEKDIFYNNEAVLERYGFPPGEQPVFSAQLFFELLHPNDVKSVQEAFSRIMNGEDMDIQTRVKISSPEGSRYEWFEYRIMTLKRPTDNRVHYVIGTATCIEKYKQIELDLIKAKKEAEESNRLKSAFLANMSHEIRTPLNAIVGFSGILASTEDNDEKQEYVSIIENNNNLLLHLIGDILDLSKIEAGALDLSYSDVDINLLFSELEQSTQLRLSNKPINLQIDIPNTECIIHTDKNRILQVINNLINNAIKFTSEGYIQFGYKILPNGNIYFYVSDTGCGIPAEQQTLIFGRFVKLNNFAQGSGLGLSICESIVQKFGGEIGVKSEVEKGSTFWFTIPYIAAKQSDKGDSGREFIPERIKEKENITILIAEDNPSNYKLFESILKKDYKLVHAWNGQEAVELFKTCHPHLILMDIKMPVLDGYKATDEIRKLSQSVPIIAVTAHAFSDDEQRITKSGFDGYTSKPINSAVLKNKILTLLKKHLVFI